MEKASAPEERTRGHMRLKLGDLPADKTALLIVDMVNGFARDGALASERVGRLIEPVAALSGRCRSRGIARAALCDRHTAHSIEFASFPQHCLEGTAEAELVGALSGDAEMAVIPKNSTNAFLEEGFRRWLDAHGGIDTFVIAGDCTDICVLQLALTLKAHFNRLDRPSRIIVPREVVGTYDAPGHDADYCETAAFTLMRVGGVEVVGGID